MTKDRVGDLNDIWPSVSDSFLEFHLPGHGAAISAMRNAVAALNSYYNENLVRSVMITGETGAGKNHLARVIAGHRAWLRESAGDPSTARASLERYASRFDEVALPSLSESLIESELFGHKKGAFTGADRERQGLLAGDVDDLLLDEVGDASATVQAKLLAVLETRRFRKLGANKEDEEETDARILFATHRDLGRLVQAGQFREDLYWRAMEFTLVVPPLRNQRENIPQMIAYQLEGLTPRALYEVGVREAPVLSGGDIDWATAYDWPGNLRQLRHTLTRWLAANGTVPLETAAKSTSSLVRAVVGGPHVSGMSRASVTDLLDRALGDDSEVAPQLNDLVAKCRREIEDDIVAWYDRASPSPEKLLTLFPGMKTSSMISKLSQWRTRE